MRYIPVAIFLSCLPVPEAALKAEDKPNVILILADDQGYADLGCFGSKTIKTPNIDRMARKGARLTSFYAAAPICTPTRAALMTGCYATRVGLPTPLHVYDTIGLNSAEFTLPESLQQQGYRTACIGKWHLGHTPKHFPTRHGFDDYWGTPLGHMFNRASAHFRMPWWFGVTCAVGRHFINSSLCGLVRDQTRRMNDGGDDSARCGRCGAAF